LNKKKKTKAGGGNDRKTKVHICEKNSKYLVG